MLTPTQVNYLAKLPENVANKPVALYPWSKEGFAIAESIIESIKQHIPQYEVIFIGSMALKISGQKDIDLSVLCPAKEFTEPHKQLEALFGPADSIRETHIAWHFLKNNFEVGIYLTDPVDSKVQEQIDIFNLLTNNPTLLVEYEGLKLAAAGLPYKEYQIRKYEFFNRLLNLG